MNTEEGHSHLIIARRVERASRCAAQVIERNWIPHEPTPRQKLFLDLDCREAMYGGAAGGGKTDALLMSHLRFANIPKYSGLILMRTYSDLSKPGASMDRAHDWLAGSGARWNDQKKQWRFPSGAVLSFGYLETEADKHNFRTAEYQQISPDEVSRFPEAAYRFLFSRLRRLKSSSVPIMMRSATNPPQPSEPGALWVKRRFIPEGFIPDWALEPKVFFKEGTNAKGKTVLRAFVPARLEDNPHLDQDEYEESLQELDDTTYAQMRHGDWDIIARGNIYQMWSDGRAGYHVITWSQFASVFGTSFIPLHWQIAVGHDWGATQEHPAVVVWIARAAENSALPGAYFLFRERVFYDALCDDIAEEIIKASDVYQERPRTMIWRMSHEAKGERKTYRQKYLLPFQSWKPDLTGGIAQVRHTLRIDKRVPHPFKPELTGRPNFFCVVDDDQLIDPRDDQGLLRSRGEFAAYRLTETPATDAKGMRIPVPYALYNDAMDALRGAMADFGPDSTPKTEAERFDEQLPEHLRQAALAEARSKIEPARYEGLEMAALVERGKLRKKLAEQEADPTDPWQPSGEDED
jgi:hypothetical protein